MVGSRVIKCVFVVAGILGLMAAIATEAFAARGGGGGFRGGGGGFRGGGGRGFGRGGGGHFGGFRAGGGHNGFRGGGFRGGGFRFDQHYGGWNRSYGYRYRRLWYPVYRPVYRPSYPVYQPSYPVYTPPAPAYAPPAPAYTPPAPPPAACPPSQATYLSIHFHDNVPTSEVTKFLLAYNLKLSDGPTQEGAYRVLVHQGPVPQDQLNQLVDSLRGQTTIVSQVGT